MVLLNRTFDSTGPMLTESAGDWFGLDETNIPNLFSDASNYFNGTNSGTATHGATATMTFNGTAVYLFGSHGPKFGVFDIQIDGVHTFSGNSTFPTSAYQQLLYSNTQLSNGLHTLVMTNQATDPNANVMDIDYVMWTADIGSDSAIITQTEVDTTDKRWSFTPSTNAWSATPNLQGFSGLFSQNWQATTTTNAAATFTFIGEAITIYGAVGAEFDTYQVTLDGKFAKESTARHTEVRNGSPLYYADGLGPGTHVVTLTNKPTPGDGVTSMWIEGAVITGASELASTPGSTTSSSHSSSSSSSQSTITPASGATTQSKSKSNTAAIAGGVAAGVIVLLILLASAAFFIYRKKRSAGQRGDIIMSPPAEQTTFYGGNSIQQHQPSPPASYVSPFVTPPASQTMQQTGPSPFETPQSSQPMLVQTPYNSQTPYVTQEYPMSEGVSGPPSYRNYYDTSGRKHFG